MKEVKKLYTYTYPFLDWISVLQNEGGNLQTIKLKFKHCFVFFIKKEKFSLCFQLDKIDFVFQLLILIKERDL